MGSRTIGLPKFKTRNQPRRNLCSAAQSYHRTRTPQGRRLMIGQRKGHTIIGIDDLIRF
jgi:hypothetical protein